MDYIIENQYISKSFRIVNDHLVSGELKNKRDNSNFIPDGNGAEFIVNFIDGDRMSPKVIPVEKVEQEENCLKIHFSEYCDFIFSLIYTVNENDHFIKKQLVVTAKADKKIDYVDLENIGTSTAEKTWSIPEMKKIYNDGYYCQLGQPIYINSFFMGSESPVSENMVVGTEAHVRYFRGFALEIGKEIYMPKVVIGAARNDDKRVLRNDFLEYIKTIALPCDFRTQYNSWYDHMLNITAENIEKSFYEIEKGLTQNGVEPIDSYVVDDGWVDYKADFWKFNKKFPNELYDSTELAAKFSSEFGLWIGPRGGYNFNKPFGKRMDKAGTGNYNPKSKDICVGSAEYLKNIKKMFLDYMEKFDINYWKLDGFILEPCPKTDHGHLTGGYKEMYYITQTWENWIDIFNAMYQLRQEKGKTLWLNLTSYAHLSPWWMQYVNSIWIQNSGDIGFSKNILTQPQVEQMLTYRDDRYYDFLFVRDQQFPLYAIYNHEPIYGNTAKVSMTDEEFKKYLFMISTRGNAFWELYYSYNLMTPKKWQANAEVLKWAKSNYHILKNAQFFGGEPVKNMVYGYSSWEGEEGVISLRNPSNKPQSFTFKLDKNIGVTEGVKDLKRFNVYNQEQQSDGTYAYDDEITVELKPFEVKIYQFGAKDNRFNYKGNSNTFSIKFVCPENGDIIENDDIKIFVKNGVVSFKCDNVTAVSRSNCQGKEVVAVGEANSMIKIYADGKLDSSAYDFNRKIIVSTDFKNANSAEVINKALAYDEMQKEEVPVKKGLFAKLLKK